MDLPTLYAIGAFIQALGQNPGLEQELQAPGRPRPTSTWAPASAASGPSPTQTLALDRAQRRWDRFWAERNPELARWRAGEGSDDPARPRDPATLPRDQDGRRRRGAR